MKTTDWVRSTERLPEERGQKCLLWANGKAWLASFVSPEWGFDLDGTQECVMAHPNLWWMPIEAPDGSRKKIR